MSFTGTGAGRFDEPFTLIWREGMAVEADSVIRMSITFKTVLGAPVLNAGLLCFDADGVVVDGAWGTHKVPCLMDSITVGGSTFTTLQVEVGVGLGEFQIRPGTALVYPFASSASTGTVVDIDALTHENISDHATAMAAITSEQITRVSADDALAVDIETVTATVGDNSASITVQTAAIASINGWQEASLTTALQAGGSLASFGMFVYDDGTDTWSSVKISADDIILDGTVYAEHLSVTNLAAITANLGSLYVDGTLFLESPASTIIAGRDSLSDYGTAGFHFARVDRGGATLGFETAITTSFAGELSGLIAADDSKMRLMNPSLLVGGDATGGTATYDVSQTISLGSADSVSANIIGGGGSGGAGRKNSNADRGNAGSATVFEIYDGDPAGAGTLEVTHTASGGLGGPDGRSSLPGALGGGARNGEQGQGSSYGVGGAGSGQNSNGGDAVNFGSGGGGGGGNTPVIFEPSAAGGAGGLPGDEISISHDTSAFTNGVYVVITIGAGGGITADYGAYTGAGGAGAHGAASVTKTLSGLREVALGVERRGFFQHTNGDPDVVLTDFGLSDVISIATACSETFSISLSDDGGSTWGAATTLPGYGGGGKTHITVDLKTGLWWTTEDKGNGDPATTPVVLLFPIDAIKIIALGSGKKVSGSVYGQSLVSV